MGKPVTAVVVHGGAGREHAEERDPRRAGVQRAVEAGWAVLAAGRSALDAAVEAVVVLEDDPHFNAGLGAVLTADGTVELDASVMAGDRLAAGAVGAVPGVPNPVRLARALLEQGQEVLLVGEPAAARARDLGLRVCAPEFLVTEGARRRGPSAAAGETVGAVVRDRHGHVAAATSTGGLAGKARGRVGDSAVIGAGTYADDALGAGSATGPGEAIIRVTLVRTALDLIARGHDPAWVAEHVLAELDRRLGAHAGLILVDPTGRVGIARTTETMATAYRTTATGQTLVVD
jgi:beta-aspartyl-peptidase (threonine type)